MLPASLPYTSIAAVLQITNKMPLAMVVTILSAVLLLRTGQNTKIKGDAAIAMISVGALAIGYLLMNIFSTSSNLSGDVCSTLFGSTSILTLSPAEVWLCVGMSVLVVAVFVLFYNKIFAVTFDEKLCKGGRHEGGALQPADRRRRCGHHRAGDEPCGFPADLRTGDLPGAVRHADVQELSQRDHLCGSPFGFLCAARHSGVHSRRYAGRFHHRRRSDRRFRSVVAGRHGIGRCSQMKKILCALLIALTLVPLAACGREKDKGAAAADSADNQAPESSVSQKQPAEKKSESKPAASEPTQSTDGVDVDLTRFSSTMVYSKVYNMMYAPDDYIGKTIKMTGQFVYYENPDTKAQYFTCIIGDAMACCSQGLEFVLTGKHTYPDDYPELGSEITVSGTFELYEEGDIRYCRLVDAEMIGQ